MIAQALRYRFFLPALFVIALGVAIGFYIARAADGEVVSEQKISDTAGQFTATLDDYDNLGFSVAAIGDLNGDSIPDLAVGAYGDDDGSVMGDRGAIYILFMDADGTVDDTVGYAKISDTAGEFNATLDNSDRFGRGVAGIGDLNSDGVEDIAVGVPGDDDGGSGRGAVYILFMDADGTVDDTVGYAKISDTAGEFTATLDDFDSFGSSVALLGDLNGDGIPDLAIGTPNDSDGGSFRGAVYILFMDADGTVDDTVGYAKISDTAGEFTATLDDSDAFGWSIAGIGDLNGDGIPDLAVGANNDDDGGEDRGAAYILFMDADGTVDDTIGYAKISDTAGEFTATLDDFDNFGNSVAGIGDFNDDGVPDLVIGAHRDDDGGSGRGAVYILFMDADGTLDATAGASGAGWTKISDTSGGLTTTLDDSDAFGYSVVSIGDLNDDGIVDLAVGASGDDDGGGDDRGAIYTLFLEGGDGTSPTAGGGGTISATPSFFTMDLSWTAATDNVTAANDLVYKVYRAAAGADLDSVLDIEANGTLVSTQTGGDVTYTLIDLQPNTVYTYNVIVSDEASNKTAYTQGSAQTLYPSQAPITYIERPYFNIRGDDCSWDRNIILEIGGKNIDSVVVADNGQFLNAAWQPFRANTVINTSGGPTKVMEIHKQLPRDYGTYTYFAIVKSVTGNQSRTMIDAITLTSRAGCTYPTRQRIPYFGKSDTDIAAYQDAIDKAMDLEEELAHEKALQEEANASSPVYVEGVKEGDLIKMADSSALYYVAKANEPTETTTGLTRHAFPNEQIFSTWYSADDMKRAQLVTQTTMDRIPLKAPMPPKPNSTLVQFENDKTVYLPSININAKPNTTPYNIALRPITTDGLTEELFGRDYRTTILTLPEALKPQMTLGSAITKFEASIAKLKSAMKMW